MERRQEYAIDAIQNDHVREKPHHTYIFKIMKVKEYSYNVGNFFIELE